MPLTRGERLGPYEIVEPLGSGGMGEVYRAWDPKLARNVAIKVLNADATPDAAAVKRFEQEARLTSALNHPSIVTIHDTGHSDSQFYIVMEIVEGQSLRHLMARGRPTLKKALQIASQLADALAKAHEVGIVHRDLKPENVMVSGDGHVKIVDFGLAKLAEPAAAFGSPGRAPTSTLSTRELLLGTIGYMSPEQASGLETDFRTDQFAFGAILYELMTGARAFHKSTGVETLAMIISGEPARALTINPTLPLPIVWLIDRCLSKDPVDRYASTRDLAQEAQNLRDHAADLDALEHPFRAGALRRSTAVVVAALTAAILLGAGATAAYFMTRADRAAHAVIRTPATFKQLTFRRGYVDNARFPPDAGTIFYSATWDGGLVETFETRSSSPESRTVLGTPAGLASISRSGELALLRRCRLDWGQCIGTLATMPLGGAPRDLLENVISADWAPDGRTLAAVQVADGEYRLHYPVGKLLYATSGRLGYMKFSPRGDRIAMVEYPVLSDESGFIRVVDLAGKATTVASGWRTIRGLDWSPAGNEIWVSASESGKTCSIYAVSLAGTRRLILHTPGDTNLYDVAPDNRVLLAHGMPRTHMIWSGAKGQRELSWLDWSTVADLSADGKTVLFYEWGQAVGATPVVYIRNVDGSDAIRLGEGKALALSPDRRWALALQETSQSRLVLLPTGTGDSRSLPAGRLTDFYWAKWFPDGKRLLVVGAGPDGAPGSYIQEIDTGRLEPIAEKGMLASMVSPDGRRLLVGDPLEGFLLWPLDGSKPTVVQGLGRDERPIQWSADGRYLYLKGPEDTVIRIYRFDLATARRELLREFVPRDPSGVIGVASGRSELAMSQDGSDYVFTYWAAVRYLFLAEGLPQ
jgi:eukaryotic-like serine/threonine-protein kinase